MITPTSAILACLEAWDGYQSLTAEAVSAAFGITMPRARKIVEGLGLAPRKPQGRPLPNTFMIAVKKQEEA